MRNERELSKDVDKARLASEFVNSSLFIEGIAILKASTLDKFESLNYNQTSEMVDCNRMLKVIDDFENIYTNIISIGEAAASALEDIRQFDKEKNDDR